MDTAVFDIYYDSLTEASWFASLHPAFNLRNNRFHLIERRGNNPELIEKITEYDKPDIILVKDGRPLLVIEITQEVPTGHNVGQRFARLVRAVELGIPTIYFFPFDARKHGEYAGICNLNIRLLKAAKNMLSIHNTPLLCVSWITDADGEIIVDGTENNQIKEILDSYVESGFNKNAPGIQRQLQIMDEEYTRRLNIRPSYATVPPSVQEYKTDRFIEYFNLNDIPENFCSREKTFVYTMAMTPDKCKRQDPYTGTTFIYDYMMCRNGENVSDKYNNLVLHFPNITKETWLEKNPNNPHTKSCNWYLTANLMLFNNGYLFIR